MVCLEVEWYLEEVLGGGGKGWREGFKGKGEVVGERKGNKEGEGGMKNGEGDEDVRERWQEKDGKGDG